DKSQKEIILRDKIAEIFRETTEGNVFHKVLGIILNELNSKIGYFGYINENGDLVKPSLTKEIWNDCQIQGKHIIFPKEEWGGLWGKSLKERKSLMANEGLSFPNGHIKIKNVMCVPMLHQSKLIGQIVIGNNPKGYSEEDINRLESIANLITPILYEKLEKEKLKNERLKIEKKLKNSQKSLEKLKEEIDHIDKQILKELYEEGKKSLEEISQNVIKDDNTKMSHTGVKNRIKKLTKSNILKIQGNINIKKLNFREAFILIELKDYENLKNFLKIPPKCPRIFLLATTTGNYHLIMGIVGKNLEDINYCINKCNLLPTTDIKRFEIIFSPSLEVPKFIPIDLFNKAKFKEKREKICGDCENAEFGICGKCGVF
ncbi:MAG: GAF domain-containing protein, partial [Candidatus Lokiarchaeota archaeon]